MQLRRISRWEKGQKQSHHGEASIAWMLTRKKNLQKQSHRGRTNHRYHADRAGKSDKTKPPQESRRGQDNNLWQLGGMGRANEPVRPVAGCRQEKADQSRVQSCPHSH
jgi:hypothetical protein